MEYKKVKQGQKYIVVCIRSISRNIAGLGNSGSFPKDSFVTNKGTPTLDPNDPRKPAQVYKKGHEDFPFDFHVNRGVDTLYDFFAPVPVEVTINILNTVQRSTRT